MKTKLGLTVMMVIFLFLFAVSFLAVSETFASARADRKSIMAAYDKLPLYFIENKGQLNSKVRFYAKTSSQTLYFTDQGIVFDLLRDKETARKGAEKNHLTRKIKKGRLVFNLGFEHSRRGILIQGLDREAARINSFVGNDRSRWKTGISTYKSIIYQGIYKGIDLKVFGNGTDIEYEFIVHPGGNPGNIVLTYNGIEGITTNGDGELLISTAFGKLKETRPHIYQEIEGKRTVDGSFKILEPAAQSHTGTFSYGFQLASYDPSYPLIIDPTLSYANYLGGSDNDDGRSIAVDASGNVYVTGYTESSDFPTQGPYQGIHAGGNYDVFITKFDSSGALSYSTYLGGSGNDYGQGIAVDSSGNAYVTGFTYSSNFPTINSYQRNFAGIIDAFVTKLDASGSTLIYSTYLGGSSLEWVYNGGIAIDGSGNAYVTGESDSSDFPMHNAYQGTFGGGVCDAFITKLDASGSALTYSTYLGGSSGDCGFAIVVDGSGNAYVVGLTASSNFPTKGPYQGTFGGGNRDAFVTKFDSSGNALSYSTYLGGSGNDYGQGLAVDASGNVYVTGYTGSTNFPTHNAYQGNIAGIIDAFVTKLDVSGNALSYSTYLGGSANDYGSGIAVDGAGNAYITGSTYSRDFPTKDPYQGTFGGGDFDAFVTKVSSSGSGLTYSTYLGGSSGDSGWGIDIDSSGNAYVTGTNDSTDFPTFNPYQETYGGGGYDAFVAKFGDAISPFAGWVTISGTVLYDETPVCAMVLANGQYMFTCGDSLGLYDLKVPLDQNEEITLYGFCSGLSPFKAILTPDKAQNFYIPMTQAPADSREIEITAQTEPGTINPDYFRISGTVMSSEETPLCAMVLANGQNMFSCGADLGKFDLEVPLDGNGEITLYVFCSGFAPYKEVLMP